METGPCSLESQSPELNQTTTAVKWWLVVSECKGTKKDTLEKNIFSALLAQNDTIKPRTKVVRSFITT